eukprot:5970149-Pleurochrysis_carterae.AAC.1
MQRRNSFKQAATGTDARDARERPVCPTPPLLQFGAAVGRSAGGANRPSSGREQRVAWRARTQTNMRRMLRRIIWVAFVVTSATF